MTEKIRILQLGKYFKPFNGGIELVSYEMSQALSARDIVCDVLCVGHDGMVGSDEQEFKVVRCRSLFKFASTEFSWEYITKLRDLMDEYDILHVHLPNPLAHLAIILTQPKAKIVLHWHSDIIKQRILKIFYAPFLRRLIKKSSAVIGATKAHVDESDYSDLFRNKKFVIPYIFNYSELASRPVDKIEVGLIHDKYDGRKIVFSVGRHVYYKGFEHLIEAAKYLPDDFVIVIGGSGPDTGYLRKKIETLKLERRVFLIGRVTDQDLCHYFDSSKVFVFPSVYRSEMYGMVQLEAFARGTPVVATFIPRSGVPHVNRDGYTGCNVSVGCPEEIANAVLEITQAHCYETYCSQTTSWLNSRFNLGDIVSKHIDLYKRVLSKSG